MQRTGKSDPGSPVNIDRSKGITLVGYARGDFGIAQNLRSVAEALADTEYPFDICELNTDGLHNETDLSLSHLMVDQSTNFVQLYCVNADQTRLANDKMGSGITEFHHRIGYWFWELSEFPDDWMCAFDYVDEVWAPSRFIFKSLCKVSPKPLFYIPVAVDFSIKGEYSRAYFNLLENKFLFLFSYDLHSFSQRKNPEAVIKAFLQAFPIDEMGVGLVIKINHGKIYPETYLKLLELTKEDSRIKIINQLMTRDEMYGLIDACDCYVSLHRAEGFGLGLAESMLLGKPVIGTGYSGNMDFMSTENSCVVNYKMVPVPRDAYPYWFGQEWAEPDIEQAAGYMKRLYEDPAYRSSKAIQGQECIRREHSFSKVGTIIRGRLEKNAQVLQNKRFNVR
jgi:glycosyltransferase involved in cell wall biosynthesis